MAASAALGSTTSSSRSTETAVRREIEQFNERVIRARNQLPAGPPLITMPRDVEATVTAWADRGAARYEEARVKAREEAQADDRRPRRLFGKRAFGRRR